LLPLVWQPTPSADLIRVGPEADGGYVIPRSAMERSKVLLGLGVNDDWRFEEAFQALSGAQVVCYDHSVTGRFWVKRLLADVARIVAGKGDFSRLGTYLRYRSYFGNNATHVRKSVGYDGANSVSLTSILAPYKGKDAFLKIDIEGWEYRIIDQIESHPDVVGFVIEFHDIDLHRDRITRFLTGLRRYKVVHLHPNNCGGTDNRGDPLVVEATFLRDDLFVIGNPKIRLDYPNSAAIPDLILAFG
jgi:hypothetical protein